MKKYITSEIEEEIRNTVPIRFGPIGKQVFARTYSRKRMDGSPEDWVNTCVRVVNGNLNFVPERFIEKNEAKSLLKLFVGMEAIPAGRHLWATGIGNNKAFLQNCFGCDFTDRFSEHFEFTFMRLMEGGGVGANYSNRFINSRNGTPEIEGKPWVPLTKHNLHIVCSPEHKDYHGSVELEHNEDSLYPGKAYWFTNTSGERTTTNPNDPLRKPYIAFNSMLSEKYSYDWDPSDTNGGSPVYLRVECSREGWAVALVKLLDLYSDEVQTRDIVVDVSNVRCKGAELKGFGGTASGPEALMLLLMRITLLLNNLVGKPLDSLTFMLIDHYIGQAVVSGGVRRSARIGIKYWGDPDIIDFITCKQVKKGCVPGHWTANISIVVDSKFFRALKRKDKHACKIYQMVCESMLVNGEPGFINASKCKEGEAPGTEFYGVNPCSEVIFVRYPDMYSFDNCCLAHVNLSRVTNPEEAFRLLTRLLIRATFAPCSNDRQRENVERNRRIGVGIFGYHNWLAKNKIRYSDAPAKESVRKFLRKMYEIVDKEAKEYARQLRIPEPIKKTTLAPTGSISTLSGDVSSAQCSFAKFYIRRVRYSNNDKSLAEKIAAGYPHEQDRAAANTTIVEYLTIDPLYDEIVDMFTKELLSEGIDPKGVEKEAKILAEQLVEDQTDIALEDVLATQAMFQKEYVDNAISMTINVHPEDYAPKDLMDVLKHYLPDLKGVAIFPEGNIPQSPLQRTNLAYMEEMEAQGRPIERSQVEFNCAHNACPIR